MHPINDNLLKRFARWIPRLCRRPWFAVCVLDDFTMTERWFCTHRGVKQWVEQCGRDEQGNRYASYGFMWGFPKHLNQ